MLIYGFAQILQSFSIVKILKKNKLKYIPSLNAYCSTISFTFTLIARMNKTIACALLLAIFTQISSEATAQGLSAFVNSRGEFYAFDNGNFQMLHHLPPEQFKVGYHHIAFIDHKGQFKVYSEGQLHDLKLSSPDKFYPMHSFLLIENNKVLVLFQDGKKFPLVSNLRHPYSFSDTMIAFVDYGGDFKILSNNTLKEISHFPPRHMKAGPNNVAYTDQSNAFRYFLDGQTHEIYHEQPAYLLTDGDLWYKNRANEVLVFDGELYATGLERITFKKALNNAFHYVNNIDQLHYIFYQDQSFQLLENGESIMSTGENLVAINGLNDQFKVWYQGEIHVLENFIPDSFKTARDMIVYTDYDGSLKALIDGNKVNVTDQVITSFVIHGKVIQYVGVTGREVLYYDGHTYPTN